MMCLGHREAMKWWLRASKWRQGGGGRDKPIGRVRVKGCGLGLGLGFRIRGLGLGFRGEGEG
jgi:hypothetical protein